MTQYAFNNSKKPMEIDQTRLTSSHKAIMYNTTLDAPDSEPSHRKGLPRGHMVSAFKADKKTFLHLTVPRELTGHDAHYDLNTKRNGGCCPDLQLLKGETPSKPLTQ